MSQKKGSGGHLARAAFACLLSLIIVTFGYCLLILDYLSGASFVSLFAIALVTGFILAQWPRLSELSLLGSSVKLRELTTSAEQAIERLETGRVNLYRTALALSLRHPGGVAVNYGDGRSKEFVLVAGMIESEGLVHELANDLFRKSNLLIARQYDSLSGFAHAATGFSLAAARPEIMVDKFRVWISEEGQPYAEDHTVYYVAEQIELLRRLQEINQEAEAALNR